MARTGIAGSTRNAPAEPSGHGLMRRFLRAERGATAIEYALIASLIAMAIVTGVTVIGTSLNTKFANIATLTK